MLSQGQSNKAWWSFRTHLSKIHLPLEMHTFTDILDIIIVSKFVLTKVSIVPVLIMCPKL